MSECKSDEILEQIADELTQLPGDKFCKTINLLHLCAGKAKDLRAKLEAAEKVCKNCTSWKPLGDGSIGECLNEKLTDDDLDFEPDGLLYGDADGYSAILSVGEEFGCIHFKKREDE